MAHDIEQSDWNGVYYDRDAGDFYVMDVRDEGVALIGAFTGEEYEVLNPAEFIDNDIDGTFEEVSPSVVRDPAETVENILYEAASAISRGSTKWGHWSPVDADFAITATNLSVDDDAPYHDTIE